jgi:hypothetical protein
MSTLAASIHLAPEASAHSNDAKTARRPTLFALRAYAAGRAASWGPPSRAFRKVAARFNGRDLSLELGDFAEYISPPVTFDHAAIRRAWLVLLARAWAVHHQRAAPRREAEGC